MRKSDLLIDALFLALYQVLSCLAIYFVAWMFLKFANKFVEVGFFASNLIFALIMGIGVGALLWVYAYKSTYRSAHFVPLETVITSLIAIAVHFLLGAVFNYSTVIAGMTLPLSGLIVYGNISVAPESFSEIPGLLPPLLFLLIMIFYHIGMFFLRKLAKNRRLMDRYELTGTL